MRALLPPHRHVPLRHSWASWHVQNGTPLFALHELGGWESSKMVRRYAHLAAEHLAPYAERLCAMRAIAAESDGTNTAQGWKIQGLASLQALERLVGRVGIEPTTNGLRVRCSTS